MSYTYDVSVIIVNYNGKKYIHNLLESLCDIEHEDFTYEVVFEDNASTDDSIEYLKRAEYEKRCNLTIVESKENLGFAGGNNLAVENAKGKYIFLLNNDTKVEKKWLSEAYHMIIKNKGYGMVNSKLVFFNDFVQMTFLTKDKIVIERTILINGNEYKLDNKFIMNALCYDSEVVCFGHTSIAIPLLDGVTDYQIALKVKSFDKASEVIICDQHKLINSEIQFIIEKDNIKEYKYTLIQNAGSGVNENFDGYDIGFCDRDGEKYNEVYEIGNGCGAAILMLKSDFEQCGKFDERFFMYYEDTDLSYRIKKLGKKIMFCPSSVVRHIHTGSSTEWSPFFTYHVYRNKLLFIKKNISTKQYIKHFVKQLLIAARERSKVKMRGTWDSLKILQGQDIHYS